MNKGEDGRKAIQERIRQLEVEYEERAENNKKLQDQLQQYGTEIERKGAEQMRRGEEEIGKEIDYLKKLLEMPEVDYPLSGLKEAIIATNGRIKEEERRLRERAGKIQELQKLYFSLEKIKDITVEYREYRDYLDNLANQKLKA